MNTHELSDLDADALTITTRGPYTWVTCTADGEEVTVGPVPTRKLTGALPRYSDDMDGGVTCALIDKEAEDHGGPLDETVDFWRARWQEAADRADARDLAAHQWKEATREHVRRFTAAMNAYDQARAQEFAAVARAGKAEKERDEARHHECSDLDAHWRLDETLASLKEANATVASLRAAQPRPLTADDITDEARGRAYRAVAALSVSDWDDMSGVAKGRAMALVEAVITEITRPEPSTRPEGAEEIEAMIREVVPSHPEDRYGDLANRLAERGVRPPGAES